jgi:hypothetical protein
MIMDTKREAFENHYWDEHLSWLDSNERKVAFKKDDNGLYLKMQIEHAYLAWQAALATNEGVITVNSKLPHAVRIGTGTVGKGCTWSALLTRIDVFNEYYDDKKIKHLSMQNVDHVIAVTALESENATKDKEIEELETTLGCLTDGISASNALTEALHKSEIAVLQAVLDTLMLEHCPGVMTGEQLTEWAKHQETHKD